ncbi:MAG: DUF2007 domain-containing protein [Cocleimonas sp.]
MKQVFTAEDRLLTHHYKNLLENEGIECLIKNDVLAPIAGELAANQSWPELWVINPNVLERAKTIISQSDEALEKRPDWVCEKCGEKHSGRFIECWNCE